MTLGDQAIVALTRQLQMTLRGSDVIGRFGGDEFAVIMCGTPANQRDCGDVYAFTNDLATLRLS